MPLTIGQIGCGRKFGTRGSSRYVAGMVHAPRVLGARDPEMKLFVYGTLRRGEPGHGLLKNATFVAQVRTEPSFELVDMGGYPALVEGGKTAVTGEIYEVEPELLAELDRYEDVPQLYQHARLAIGGYEVLLYLLPAALAVGRPRLSSGDWCAR